MLPEHYSQCDPIRRGMGSEMIYSSFFMDAHIRRRGAAYRNVELSLQKKVWTQQEADRRRKTGGTLSDSWAIEAPLQVEKQGTYGRPGGGLKDTRRFD